MRRQKTPSAENSMSFLDVICCSFGAIILLLIITKPFVPNLESISIPETIKTLQTQLFSIQNANQVQKDDIDRTNNAITADQRTIERLKQKITQLKQRTDAAKQSSASSQYQKEQLEIALQTLTEEMRRLQQQSSSFKNNLVGGIPVDSEYIIFIIDTSGSMFNYGWQRMMQEMLNILNIYPTVKGIQVMNDMGDYMFSNYRGKWIPDTDGRRKVIMNRLRSWNPFSNSSPVEGIQKAIRTYYNKDKKISLYVLGDEFTGRSIKAVIDTVERINKKGQDKNPLVRIHGVGFPIQFARPKNLQTTGIRFASLMRELTRRNGGTFVGLNAYEL